MVRIKTNARIGILGNPSDIYNGVVISSTIKDFFVKGEVNKAEKKIFLINNEQNENFNNIVGSSLILLSQKGFNVENFSFKIKTNIPVQGGLSGSTAITVNLFKGLNKLFSLNLNLRTIAHYTRLVEHEIIGNTAGPQDCFVDTFGGAKYMDFSSDDWRNYIIEDLDIKDIPFYIGVRSKNISSGDIHRFPFLAYPTNSNLIKIVNKIRNCAIKGKEAIINKDLRLSGNLMNENQKLTQTYGRYGNPTETVILQREIDQEILNFCNINNVIGAKLGGSSGSLIILSEEKPNFLLDFILSEKLQKKMKQFDANPSENQIFQVLKLEPAKKY